MTKYYLPIIGIYLSLLGEKPDGNLWRFDLRRKMAALWHTFAHLDGSGMLVVQRASAT